MKWLMRVLFTLFVVATVYGGEISNSRLWLETELDKMDADGGENQLRFMVNLPNEPGNVRFYTSSPGLTAQAQGKVTITSTTLDFGIVLYAKYTAPTLEAEPDFYGERTVKIHLEWDPTDGASTMVDLPVIIDLGPQPELPYKITNIQVYPSAQNSTIAGIIPADTNCFACIAATVSGIPEGKTPTVRFDSFAAQHLDRSAFVSSNPDFNFDRSYIEIYVSQENPVAKAYYHRTENSGYMFTDTITASIGSSSTQTVIQSGMELKFSKIDAKLHSSGELYSQFGVHPYVVLSGAPDFNLQQYALDYQDLWSETPRHSGEYGMKLGALIGMERINLTYYDSLMRSEIWGNTPTTFSGFTQFVRNETNNMLECKDGSAQPAYPWGAHWLPGVELTKDGLYWFLLNAQLSVQVGLTTTNLAWNTITQTNNSQFSVARDGPNGIIEDMACALTPQSVGWYTAIELIKNFYKPADYALFFADVLCKLQSKDVVDAIISATKQGVSFRADQLDDLVTKGVISATKGKELKILSVILQFWNGYDHTKNVSTLVSTNSTTGSKDFVTYPDDYADQPDFNPYRGGADPDYLISTTQLSPSDAEYQHLATTTIVEWFGTNGVTDTNFVIIAANEVKDAALLLNGTTPVTPYQPETFDYPDVKSAMSYFSNNIAVFYMPDTNDATLTVHITNSAAISVLKPRTGQYSVYRLPVLSAATGTLSFSAASYTNDLTLHAGRNVVQIPSQTYSLTGTAWVAAIIEPEQVADGGGAWRILDGNGRKSGHLMQVSPGLHTVEYGSNSQWRAPFCVRTMAFAGKTNVLFGLYGRPDAVKTYDFSDVESTNDWTSLSGVWSLTNGAYQMTGQKKNTYCISHANESARSYTFSADVRKVQGDSSSYAYGYGIVIRCSETADSFYEFLILEDGRYMIGRQLNGQYETLVSYTASDALLTGLNTWNNLKAVANNDEIEFYINGQIVRTVTQTKIATGMPGFLVIDAAESEVNDVVQFKNARFVNGQSSGSLGWLMLLLTQHGAL